MTRRHPGGSVSTTMTAHPLRLYLGLHRDIYVLFVAQLVNSMGSFVFPFLTLLLVKKLGFAPEQAGVVLLVVAGGNVCGAFAGGKLSDHLGRKPVIVGAQSIVVVLFLACSAFGAHLVIVGLIVVAEIALGAVGPATNALVTDRAPRERRQASFSLIYLGFNLGFAVGLFLAGLLFERYLTWIFIGNALSTACSMVLVLAFVRTNPSVGSRRRYDRERPTHAEALAPEAGSAEEELAESTVAVLLHRPYLLFFFGAVFLITFVYAQVNFTLPLQLTRLFPVDGTTLYGTLMSVTCVYVVVLTPIVVAVTRRLSPLANQVTAAVLYAIGFGSVGYLKSFPLYLVAAFVWTAGEVLFATYLYVYVANHSPRSHRGRLNSIVPLVMQAGFALNPPLVGAYLAGHSADAVWSLMFVVGIGAAVVLLLMALSEKRNRTAAPTGSS